MVYLTMRHPKRRDQVGRTKSTKTYELVKKKAEAAGFTVRKIKKTTATRLATKAIKTKHVKRQKRTRGIYYNL